MYFLYIGIIQQKPTQLLSIISRYTILIYFVKSLWNLYWFLFVYEFEMWNANNAKKKKEKEYMVKKLIFLYRSVPIKSCIPNFVFRKVQY